MFSLGLFGLRHPKFVGEKVRECSCLANTPSRRVREPPKNSLYDQFYGGISSPGSQTIRHQKDETFKRSVNSPLKTTSQKVENNQRFEVEGRYLSPFLLVMASASYQQVPDYQDEDETSYCESVNDSPPFALVDDDDAMVQKKKILAVSHSADLLDSDAYMQSQKMDIANSPAAWSSITAGTEKTAQMGSSIASYSPSFPQNSDGSTPLPDSATSQIEFEAAASLLASSSMMGHSLNLRGESSTSGSNLQEQSGASSSSSSSLRFSQLMWEADDRNEIKARMPTLPEDQEMKSSSSSPPSQQQSFSLSSNLSPRASAHSLFPSNELISPVQWPTTSSSQVNRDIEASQVSEDTLEVRLRLGAGSSAREVLDVIGNPDLLRLWCEPIENLIVTRSSEGARSAMNRQDDGGDRQVS